MSEKPFILALLLILQLVLLRSGACAAQDDKPVLWKKIGDDLELAHADLGSSFFFPAQLTLVRSALRRYRIAVIRASEFGRKRADVRSLAEASRALVAINANFFDELGHPLGLVVSRGIPHNPLHRGGKTLTGIFQATRNGVAIVKRDAFTAETVVEAVQAGPLLISNSVALPNVQETKGSSRRSGVCVDAQGRVLLFCVSPGFGNTSLEELQNLLSRKTIGCVAALNLDGGGSSQLYVSRNVPGSLSDSQEILLSGRDEVPVALGLFPRQ